MNFIFLCLFFLLNSKTIFSNNTNQSVMQSDQNVEILENFKLILSTDSGQFPSWFNLSFSYQELSGSRKFIRRRKFNAYPGIYVIDSKSSQPVKYNGLEQDGEDYEMDNGQGYARLIRTKDKNHPFRVIATVHSNDSAVFDILPDILIHERKKRELNDDPISKHVIQKRQINIPIYFDEMNFTRNYSFEQRAKRAVNGQPIELNVELLLVTDTTVLQNFQSLAASTDNQKVFGLIRHYYSHLINGVNQRYKDSLINDPDLRINIILSNFLIITDTREEQWLSSQASGDSNFPFYNGKQTLITDRTLQNFANYINSKQFSFEFDHAAAVFNKELLSNDLSRPISDRAGTAGYCPGVICSNLKYSINEDFGGFSNLLTIAHEIGHNLGAAHDDFFAQCFPTQNQKFIMAASTSGGNLNRFSSCSIQQFKALLLNPSLNGVSQQGQCLLNTPVSVPENQLTQNRLPGEFLTPDEQCKMIYGPTATFCKFNAPVMCQILYCRKNSNSQNCEGTTGAADGTLCDSGKVCQSGLCLDKLNAPTGSCLFGDDVVTQAITGLQLTTPQMTCTNFFNLIQANSQSISGYCSDNLIGSTCCQSCKKYNSLVCKDSYWNCINDAPFCDIKNVFINGGFQLVRNVCPRSCGQCTPSPLTCQQANNICLNGAICQNINVPSTSLFGFQCVCSPQYTGELCQTKISDTCSSNPCLNGGTCQNFGSLGYVCICPNNCQGYNCNICSGITNILSSSSNNPTTSTIRPTTSTIRPTTSTLRPTTSTIRPTTSTIRPTTSTIRTTIFVNPCNSNPCQNGGTCQIIGTRYSCFCASGCTGPNCGECFATILPTISTTQYSSVTDYNSAACQYYKSQNLCENNAFIGTRPIKEACPESCNSQTTTTTVVSISDFNKQACEYFRSQGLCNRNAFIGSITIKEACPVTCGSNCFDEFNDSCKLWINFCPFLNQLPNNPCKKTCLSC